MRIFKPQYSKLLDEELLVMLGKGDKRAFDEVYKRYSQPLFGYFMKLLARDNEKCEDMVHDLFAKIIRKPEYFDTSRSFRTWVYSVASNMCKNEYSFDCKDRRRYSRECALESFSEKGGLRMGVSWSMLPRRSCADHVKLRWIECCWKQHA